MSDSSPATLLMIVCSPHKEEEVVRLLGDGATIIPNVWGQGKDRAFHDTRAWAGHLLAVFAVVSRDQVATLSKELRALRTTAQEATPSRFTVTRGMQRTGPHVLGLGWRRPHCEQALDF